MSSAYRLVTTDLRDLQRRRQLAALLAEVAGQDPELADLLGPRDGPVRLLHRRGDLAAQLGIVDEVRGRPRTLGLAVLPPPPGQRIGVHGDQRGDERLPVTDDENLPDERVCPQPVFEHCGGDVLAPGRDEDLLLAARDPQEPRLVELADVAGVEPAVGQRLGGGVRVVVVAAEDDRTADEDLPVVRDPDGQARDGPPDGADPVCGQRVHRDRGGGLGEAVALQHRQADPAEEVPEQRGERGAARHRRAYPATQRRPQPPVDQHVEQRAPELEPHPGTARVACLAPRDRRGGGGVEDLALAPVGGLAPGAVEDLLEDPGNRQQHGGPEGGQVVEQVLGVGGVAEHGPAVENRALHDLAEDVGQRQEQQERALTVEQLGQHRDHRADLGDEVGVGQLAALGTSGGAGCVDQRREIVRPGRRAALVHLRGGHRGPAGGQHLHRTGPVALGLDPPDVLGGVLRARHGRRVPVVLDDHGLRAGVREDPRDLFRRRGLVDRDGHGARDDDRIVEQGPLIARAGEQADAVSRLDPGRDQAAGDGDDLGREGGVRDIRPSVAHPPAERDGPGVLVGEGEHGVGHGVAVVHAHARGDTELAHVPTSSADAGLLRATYRQTLVL